MQELAQCLKGGENTFECPNCLAKEHQCFFCKVEGKEKEDVFR